MSVFDTTTRTGTGDRSGAVSATAVAAVSSAGAELSERAVVDLAVAAVLAEHPAGGQVDSWAVADAFVARRAAAGQSPDRVQTKDYVQYLFRETTRHVCRHADGHHYRVHPETSCSDSCDEKYAHRAATPVREHCGDCFLELTISGECPMGC